MGEAEVTADRDDPLGLVGTIFERQYRVDRRVAEGGFGVVYQGLHLALGVRVALKILRPALRTENDEWHDLIHQFREEAVALSRLRRSSVVAVLDSGIAPLVDDPHGLPWMALEWLDGETLREHLAARRDRGGRSSIACLELLRPVLLAMADAHDIGIAHRDLKPSNIMLVPGKEGLEPRVLDFGIAKMMAPDRLAGLSGDTATDSTQRSYTPASAAPEQLSGARTGPWTDVYALGLLLTEVLTDRAPVATHEPNERHREAFAATRPTPGSMGVDVGPWEAVLQRALAVRPAERQPNARRLLEELERALRAPAEATTGAPTTATPRRFSAPTGTGFRRLVTRPRLAAAVVLLLVGAAAYRERSRATSGELAPLSTSARPLVMVSEFRSDERARSIAATFAELLSDQLRVGDAMRVPTADVRAGVLEASGLDASTSVTPALLTKVREAVGADVLVSGEVSTEGDQVRAQLDLYDAARGTRLGSLSLSGRSADLSAFVRDAGARVRRGLGRPALSVEDEAALRSSLPEDTEASLAYVQGMKARQA
ncbi:MAG TPA: serine/threonine-protein kinase, partial [Polyangiaceae bacterium]